MTSSKREAISLVYTKEEAEGWTAGAVTRDVSPLELLPAYPWAPGGDL